MYKYITNPITGNKISIFSKSGEKIIKNYIDTLLGGSNCSQYRNNKGKKCPHCCSHHTDICKWIPKQPKGQGCKNKTHTRPIVEVNHNCSQYRNNKGKKCPHCCSHHTDICKWVPKQPKGQGCQNKAQTRNINIIMKYDPFTIKSSNINDPIGFPRFINLNPSFNKLKGFIDIVYFDIPIKTSGPKKEVKNYKPGQGYNKRILFCTEFHHFKRDKKFIDYNYDPKYPLTGYIGYLSSFINKVSNDCLDVHVESSHIWKPLKTGQIYKYQFGGRK